MDLNQIIYKEIQYPDKIVIYEKSKKLILCKTPAKGLDLKYRPISINDVPKTLGDDYLRKSLKENMIKSEYSETKENSNITNVLFNQNFKVMTTLPNPNPLVPKPIDNFELLINGTLTEYPPDIESRLQQDNELNVYSIIIGTTEKPRKFWSYSISTEAKPIIILRGFDSRLHINSKIMSSTAMHVCNILDIAELPEKSNIEHDLPSKSYLAYYLKNGLLKFGSIYWLVKDGEEVYLCDLTSSFQINPIEHNVKLTAVMNAVGLLYFYSAKKCYLENDKEHFKFIINWIFLASSLIDELVNPVEYGLAYMINENNLTPNNLDVDNPNVPVVRKDKEFMFLMYKKIKVDSYPHKFPLHLKQSTKRLEKCITFILDRLKAREINPFETIQWTFGSNDFSLFKIIGNLLNPEFEVVGNEDFETKVLVPFMKKHKDDWEFRTLVYLLIKLFQCFLYKAKKEKADNRLGKSFAYLKRCLKAWSFLNGLISPTELLTLPLEPLLRMGEISLLLSRDSDLAKRECQSEKGLVRTIDEHLNKYFKIKDERYDLQFPDENEDFGLPFVKLSFANYARAVLYTDVGATHNLLLRICHIANVISFTYLTNFQDFIANLQSHERSIELLEQISKFVNVSIKFSRKIKDEKSILMAYCNKARYLKTYYHIHEFLKTERHETDLIIKHYDEIIEEYKYAKANVGFPWNAFVWDFIQFIMEYNNLLKEMEIQDKKYYHKKIIENYQLLILLATDQRDGSDYFSLKISSTHALIAEYLFDIYRGTKLCAVREAAEMCYKKSISTFDRKNLPIVEFLKINLDLVNFYETILDEFPRLNIMDEYYDKIIEALFQCKAAHVFLMNDNWKYVPPTAYTMLSSDSMTSILVKALQEKLKKTFEMRLQRWSIDNRNVITKEKYHELLRLCRNDEEIPLINNLNEVFLKTQKYFYYIWSTNFVRLNKGRRK